MSLTIRKDACTGCSLCVKVCPFSAIEMVERKAVVDLNRCNLCGACVDVCKFDAIVLVKPEEQTQLEQDSYKDVWIFVEQKQGVIQSVAFELLGKGKELAETLKTCAEYFWNAVLKTIPDEKKKAIAEDLKVLLSALEQAGDTHCPRFRSKRRTDK